MGSVLVVVGGLPATGKSTIATALATRTATPYVRVDRIEHAIVAWSPLSHPLGPVGYAIAYELALEQLQLGLTSSLSASIRSQLLVTPGSIRPRKLAQS